MLDPSRQIPGTLHVVVAFDWGDAVDLELAQRSAPSEFRPLARRPRTPPSIDFRPAPLHVALGTKSIDIGPLYGAAADCAATVFDFGGVSVGMRVPFSLSPVELTQLAGALSESAIISPTARAVSEPLFRLLAPAIRQSHWSEIWEEYVVFHFQPGSPLASPDELLRDDAEWLAGLARLEAGRLAREEVVESLRERVGYSPEDLLITEWSAAVLIDRECEETLQTIEFANLQLLEFRQLDNRLDAELEAAYRLVHPLGRAWFPGFRTHAGRLQILGDLKLEANAVFEKTGNVLKLIGDQYLARVYRLLAGRFHPGAWGASIERSLSVAESVYRAVADQSARKRAEALEMIIAFEIVMAWLRR